MIFVALFSPISKLLIVLGIDLHTNSLIIETF